jgi:hypothetical protein
LAVESLRSLLRPGVERKATSGLEQLQQLVQGAQAREGVQHRRQQLGLTAG